MKKLVILIVALLIVTGAVFAQGMWKDGTYTAEGDAFEPRLEGNMVRVVVVNGYIVDAHFDAIPGGGRQVQVRRFGAGRLRDGREQRRAVERGTSRQTMPRPRSS